MGPTQDLEHVCGDRVNESAKKYDDSLSRDNAKTSCLNYVPDPPAIGLLSSSTKQPFSLSCRYPRKASRRIVVTSKLSMISMAMTLGTG